MVMAVTRPGIRSPAVGRLLDALEADLLTATAEELHDALRKTGRDPGGACQEIRAVLEAAMQQEDGTSLPTLRNWPASLPLYRH
jgi:hypothetical protein